MSNKPNKGAAKKPAKANTKKSVKATAEKIPLNMDEILKMLFLLSDALTVRMINSLFKKTFPLDATVVLEKTEIHRFSHAGQRVEKIVADMVLSINGEKFHIEFQTMNDETMLPRMFEYGFVIAIAEAKSGLVRTHDGMKMNYPNQYVIFVERDDKIPANELTMQVTLWDGDVKEYKVPLLRYWEETADTLEAKQLEPLLPLQVFNIRKSLDAIARSDKSETEKEKLTEEKLREMIAIYTSVSEKIYDLTDAKALLTTQNAEQMLQALHHLSAYLYDRYKGYDEIESEAIRMSEAVWSFDRWRNEGRVEGRKEGRTEGRKEGRTEGRTEGTITTRKETAYEMFQEGEKIEKIRKYSKLPDNILAEVLSTLPQTIQQNYNLIANV